MCSGPRTNVVRHGEVAEYHVWNRANHQAFQFGKDPVTGVDYTERRRWIHELEKQLASLFAVDIAFHAEMGNHLHLILRTRPDVVRHWSDAEVARRWLIIAKLKRSPRKELPEPTQEDIDHELSKPGRIETLRKRLSHLSWFMGTLGENISRQVHAQMGIRGRLWEERYRCRQLLDVAAILICAIYLDLNQIRAAEAMTPEDSRYTSAYDRIMARLLRLQAWANGELAEDGAFADELGDEWLCPLSLTEAEPEEVLLGKPSKSGKRCSDKGILPLSLDDYLKMLDFVGRQLRSDKRGAIPADLEPILKRLKVRGESFVEAVDSFAEWFPRFVGQIEHLAQRMRQQGVRRLRNMEHCAEAFE